MRVLCAIGNRGGPEIVQRLVERLSPEFELLLLHVVDTGPRHDLKHLIKGLRHGPTPEHVRKGELSAAEESTGKASLTEAEEAAKAAGFGARAFLVRGRSEEIILKVANDEAVSLICISAREGLEGHPHIGPASVGHTARFVLDHAPCDVLSLRDA